MCQWYCSSAQCASEPPAGLGQPVDLLAALRDHVADQSLAATVAVRIGGANHRCRAVIHATVCWGGRMPAAGGSRYCSASSGIRLRPSGRRQHKSVESTSQNVLWPDKS